MFQIEVVQEYRILCGEFDQSTIVWVTQEETESLSDFPKITQLKSEESNVFL